MFRIEKFLHEATYQCVCITYRPKTEKRFPKSPLQIEHILEYNMLNVSPKYLPIFCIFHNSIRKSLCLIELALMHLYEEKGYERTFRKHTTFQIPT